MPDSGTLDSFAEKKITVLIVAATRKEFLSRAVQSILHQDIDINLVEIIIVKTFSDEGLDRLIEEKGIVHIISDKEDSVGKMLARGIEISKGKVICFLDDDDVFFPNKLSYILELFKLMELTYYHNSHLRLSDAGNTHGNILYRKNQLTKSFLGNFSSNGDITFAIKANSIVNLSSVSVRREALIENLDDIREIRGATDYMMFYISIKFGGSFIIDNEVLSIYYIHRSAMRPSWDYTLYRKKLSELASNQIYVHEFGSTIFKYKEDYSPVSGLIYQWKLIKSISDDLTNRVVFKNLTDFFKAFLFIRPRYVFLFSVVSCVNLYSNYFAVNLIKFFQR